MMRRLVTPCAKGRTPCAEGMEALVDWPECARAGPVREHNGVAIAAPAGFGKVTERWRRAKVGHTLTNPHSTTPLPVGTMGTDREARWDLGLDRRTGNRTGGRRQRTVQRQRRAVIRAVKDSSLCTSVLFGQFFQQWFPLLRFGF